MNYRVRCTGYTKWNKEHSNEKYFTIGKVYDVIDGKITNDNDFCYDREKDVIAWLSKWYTFEKVNDQKIVITTDGTETLARLYDGNKVVKTATAKCSPADTFDFKTGAEIAFNRLMGVSAVKEEKKPQKEEPKFKVGDHVRFTKNPVLAFKVGDTGTIIEEDGSSIPYKVSRDGDGLVVWTRPCNLEKVDEKPFKFEVGKQYRRGDAVIEIEKAEKLPHDVRYRYKTVKGDTGFLSFFDEHSVFASDVKPYDPPKYYNGKVVCVRCDDKDFTVGKVYEFIDGSIRDDSGNLRYQGFLRCKHPSEIVNIYKFIPLVE